MLVRSDLASQHPSARRPGQPLEVIGADPRRRRRRRRTGLCWVRVSYLRAVRAAEEIQHLLVQEPVRAHGAATVRPRSSGQVSEGSACFFHDDLEGGEIPQRDISFCGNVCGALRHEDVRPEVAVGASPPDLTAQAEQLRQLARPVPSWKGRKRRARRPKGWRRRTPGTRWPWSCCGRSRRRRLWRPTSAGRALAR